jgi:hypothetical protein
MSEATMTKALVFTLLRHAEDFPWRMQDIGLMGLRLDERREYRLHVWNPSLSAGDPPIHDHPYDFTSAIIVGELTNTRYVENAAGDEYRQLAHELHASWQQPGTVTLIRCSWGVARELTVCLRDEAAWRSGQARDATREEIKSITAKAREWF